MDSPAHRPEVVPFDRTVRGRRAEDDDVDARTSHVRRTITSAGKKERRRENLQTPCCLTTNGDALKKTRTGIAAVPTVAFGSDLLGTWVWSRASLHTLNPSARKHSLCFSIRSWQASSPFSAMHWSRIACRSTLVVSAADGSLCVAHTPLSRTSKAHLGLWTRAADLLWLRFLFLVPLLAFLVVGMRHRRRQTCLHHSQSHTEHLPTPMDRTMTVWIAVPSIPSASRLIGKA